MGWRAPRLDPARELRAHLPADGWRAAVAEVCARHGIDAPAPAPFAAGSDVVWPAGGAVVKLTAPRWAWQIEAEERVLAHVAGRLPVRTPEPLARGELDGWPYVVTRRLPGAALAAVWPELARAERLRLAADLGRLARALHGLEVGGLPETWEAFRAECRLGRPARHAEPGVPAHLSAEVEPWLESAGPLPAEPRVLLHTELLDEHVLVERRAGRWELAGLLDFADARVGPAEYDFPAPVEFVFRGEPGLLRAFLLAYGHAPEELTPALSARLLAWALFHRYGRLARMLRAVAPARPGTLGELAAALYGVGAA